MLEQTVAAPLEKQITGVENMIYMSSTLDARTASLRSRSRSRSAPTSTRRRSTSTTACKQAEPRLPEEVRRQGVTVQKRSLDFLQVLAFYSPDGRYDDLFTSATTSR